MKEFVFDVQGMKCDGCVQSVKKTIEEVPGVESVYVSLDEKSAAVKARDDVTPDQLTEAFQDSSYIVNPRP